MRQIAVDAGVGRVTLYAHFDSREAVISTALTRTIADGDTVLDGIDLTEPVTGLRALTESSWSLTARASALLEAARGILTAEQIRDLHAGPERRVLDLIRRGQADGAFRDDMAPEWLASVMHHLMQGAGSDVAAGRLDDDLAGPLLADTVLSAYRADAST